MAPVSREPRSAEGVGDGAGSVADEQGALQRQREGLDQPARLGLLWICELRLGGIEVGVQPPVRAAGSAQLVEQRPGGLRLLGERPQHVEADHVARTFPDGVERRLAVEARQPALLDVSVAAQALERLAHALGRALTAVPIRRKGASAGRS